MTKSSSSNQEIKDGAIIVTIRDTIHWNQPTTDQEQQTIHIGVSDAAESYPSKPHLKKQGVVLTKIQNILDILVYNFC